jgi:hypothetical protein
MRGTKTLALGIAAATAATLGATAVVGGSAAGASDRTGIPTITAHVGGGKIVLSSGNTIHSGRITFKAVTGSGSHVLQIIRLHKGYTPQQAMTDVNKAFGGDLAAIKRVDTRMTWRGGAPARPHKPGWFTVTLRPGVFYFVDQNSQASARVRVVGTVPTRPAAPHDSAITAFTYGFETTPTTLPAAGTFRFYNQADQPHFVEMQRVKDGTTARQVKAALSPTSHAQPTWLLRAGTQTGVVSPMFAQTLSYDLPAGEYLIACFWPDRFTGMPHAFMGMWKLIHLK